MIYQVDHYPIDLFCLESPNGGVERGELSLRVISIHDNGHRKMADPCLYLLGVVAKDDKDLSSSARPEYRNDPLDEALAFNREQGLGATHPARLSSGKQNGDNHDT